MFKQKAIKIFAVALAVMVALCAPLTASAATTDNLNYIVSQYYLNQGTYQRFNTNGNFTFNTPTNLFRIALNTTNEWYHFSNGYLVIETEFNLSKDWGDIKFLYGSLYMWDEHSGQLYGSVNSSNWRNYFDLSYDKFMENNRYCYSLKIMVKLSGLPYGAFEELYIDNYFTNSITGDITVTKYSLSYLSEKDFKNSAEYEKQEVQGSGNDSVDGVTNALPNVDFSGLQTSLEMLTQQMMYNGTDCTWTFPSIYIPQIPNVIPSKIKLCEEQQIDLTKWFDHVQVIQILRALCSIGIILFIIYEMYSFIIFCMTLKSNQVGKDEESEG